MDILLSTVIGKNLWTAINILELKYFFLPIVKLAMKVDNLK